MPDTCSPHPRGWSQGVHCLVAVLGLLPAPAGMVPRRSPWRCARCAAPHARGDRPEIPRSQCSQKTCSPPAPAGMVPTWPGTATGPGAAPRTRGDGGWSRRRRHRLRCRYLLPAPRGWPHRQGVKAYGGPLLPAPAGMVPSGTPTGRPATPVPRTRGDGPVTQHSYDPLRRLLPGPAGMVPAPGSCPRNAGSAPRTRGDGPISRSARSSSYCCSPHPRGWSRVRPGVGLVARLLPAPAGMVPSSCTCAASYGTAPRTCGDGPPEHATEVTLDDCSPHPRGWSRGAPRPRPGHGLLSAPAGMVPRISTGPVRGRPAPRTRGDGGWSRRRRHRLRCRHLLPAPAGMAHRQAVEEYGGPLLPAPAGIVPPIPATMACTSLAPRTRGDGPRRRKNVLPCLGCSPHPRGWSRLQVAATLAVGPLPHPRGWSPRGATTQNRRALLPAPAGMVPTTATSSTGSSTAPRTRGDGPLRRGTRVVPSNCSPHPQGWSLVPPTQLPYGALLPAPAGMVPTKPPCRASTAPAPRTLRDGLVAAAPNSSTSRCPPHRQGWPLEAGQGRVAGRLLPCSPHAGMVPRRRPPCAATGSAPAPAGMVPARKVLGLPDPAAPRTHGDGPSSAIIRAGMLSCSLHPQGWSHLVRRRLRQGGMLPAPARMVPQDPLAGFAPRTRRDGPPPSRSRRFWYNCSPHPRGWSYPAPYPATAIPAACSRPS